MNSNIGDLSFLFTFIEAGEPIIFYCCSLWLLFLIINYYNIVLD